MKTRINEIRHILHKILYEDIVELILQKHASFIINNFFFEKRMQRIENFYSIYHCDHSNICFVLLLLKNNMKTIDANFNIIKIELEQIAQTFLLKEYRKWYRCPIDLDYPIELKLYDDLCSMFDLKTLITLDEYCDSSDDYEDYD